MIKIAWLTVLIVIVGCATIPSRNFTGDKLSYLQKVRQIPTDFEVSASEISTIWGRAQSFIAQYSSMKQQIVTDSVIQTYNPVLVDAANQNLDFGYSVIRTPINDRFKISVQCMHFAFPGQLMRHTTDGEVKLLTEQNLTEICRDNAHILAHYLKTGDLPYPEILAR